MPRLDPAPAVGEVLELDGDVVGHVPGLHEPDLDEMRLELGDPVRQLGHLEELVLVLQVVGANPERVGDQPAKAAQRDRGEGQHRRRILQRLHAGQAQLVAVAVERLLHEAGADQQHGRPAAAAGFFSVGRSLSSLRGRQFAPGENDDAEQRR